MRYKSVTTSGKAGFPRQGWKMPALATAMALTFGLASVDAQALALGRINVLSALGEPLRAEIDIPDINADEASSLRATVASPETFRASGLDYNILVSSVTVQLQKRPDGRSFLRLTSPRPVNDPFLDLILETQWSNGRIVRDYTLLFDPPSLRQPAPAPTAAQVAPAASARPAPAAPATPPLAVAAAPAPAQRPAAAPASPRPAVAAPATAAASNDSQVTVRAGDTAGRIAAARKPDSVSLDQMLVALQRSNPDAFIGGNVNRIKAGAVLDIPTAEQAAATPADEASRTVLAQSKDFNEYRRRLAQEATPASAGPERQAVGKLQADVEDKKPAAAAPDKLTLSKGGVQAKAPEARIAASAQAKEATDRAAELARNIGELAKVQAASSAAGAAPAAAVAAASATKSAVDVAVKAPADLAPAANVAAPTASASASAPQAPVAVASAAAPATPAKPVASEAVAPPPVVAAPVVKPPPPPPAAEPSLLTEIMDNPMAPVAAGGLVALLAGFGFYRARQRKKPASVDSSFLESRLQPDSFFGASGGQHIDTKEAAATGSSMVYSPSQLDAAGDVDPVAEADVYLAYGRDLQAEEILKEAMRTTPGRVAIHSKLLEIYAKRRDIKAFEVVATEAHGLTQGQGLEWEQICEHGRDLDPDNPLYQPGGAPMARPGAMDAGATASGFHGNTVPVTGPAPLDSKAPPVDLDLDLDFSASAPPAAPPRAPAPAPVVEPKRAAAAEPEFRAAAQSSGFGTIDLSMPDLPPLEPTAEADSTQAPSDSGMMEFDLGSLSLDLDPTTSVSPAAGAADITGTPSDDPLATKLALAEEFLSIGDDDGARALVEEVVAEASGGLRSKAEKLLAEIG